MLIAAVVGVLIGCVYTLSPMTVWFTLAAAALLWIAVRGLPAREQRWIVALLVGAIAIRVAMVGALFLFGSPDRIYVPFNVFFGDEQYNIVRSLRVRAIWLGLPMRIDAFSDAYEIYGRTSYLQVLALLQLLTGPSPYGVHLFNILLYVTGGIVLHRIVRHAFGPLPALGGLAFLLFLPSMLLWSTAALKESFNFLVVVSTLGGTILAARAPMRWRPLALLGVLAGLGVLQTLRDGALLIAVAGIGIGLIATVALQGPLRLVTVIAVGLVMTGMALRQPRVQAEAMEAVRSAAGKHIGHAYTRGHSYELLDSVYYGRRGLRSMTPRDAAQFVVRGITSMVIYPAPWQARSRSELAYLPEQIVWYLVVFTAVVGTVAGLRRDRLVTCVFAGYALVALVAVGVNSGNMGTLVRHRAFALPYLGALSAYGTVTLIWRFWLSKQGRYATDR
jgi:Dolichyl-phosphate-mannose-protein mannosyltransferase